MSLRKTSEGKKIYPNYRSGLFGTAGLVSRGCSDLYLEAGGLATRNGHRPKTEGRKAGSPEAVGGLHPLPCIVLVALGLQDPDLCLHHPVSGSRISSLSSSKDPSHWTEG